jgi:hypothetical protein
MSIPAEAVETGSRAPGRAVTAALLWTAGILVVFAPLAVRACRRRA